MRLNLWSHIASKAQMASGLNSKLWNQSHWPQVCEKKDHHVYLLVGQVGTLTCSKAGWHHNQTPHPPKEYACATKPALEWGQNFMNPWAWRAEIWCNVLQEPQLLLPPHTVLEHVSWGSVAMGHPISTQCSPTQPQMNSTLIWFGDNWMPIKTIAASFCLSIFILSRSSLAASLSTASES